MLTLNVYKSKNANSMVQGVEQGEGAAHGYYYCNIWYTGSQILQTNIALKATEFSLQLYSRASIIRTSIIWNLYYPALKIACFNDIHYNFGVRHLEYLLQVYIELLYFDYPDFSLIRMASNTKEFRIIEVILYPTFTHYRAIIIIIECVITVAWVALQ